MSFVLLEEELNINGILTEIQLIPTQFHYIHPGSKQYWKAVPLRNASGTTERNGIFLNHTMIRQHLTMKPCKNTSILNQMPKTLEILEHISTKYGPLGLIRILTLAAHGNIKKHTDGTPFSFKTGGITRLHLPIQTNNQVKFIIEKQKHQMKAANLYAVDVSQPHIVINDGDQNRIHLVIDLIRPAHQLLPDSSDNEDHKSSQDHK